jgi:hypothetical protein
LKRSITELKRKDRITKKAAEDKLKITQNIEAKEEDMLLMKSFLKTEIMKKIRCLKLKKSC